VLLVDDHQPQIAHRREDRRARPHPDHRLPAPQPPPLLGPLAVVEGRVQDRHPVAEAGVKLAGHRGRQRDLRHQQQRPPAQLQRAFYGAQIDLGLARARDAVQQIRLIRPCRQPLRNRIERPPLILVQLGPRPGPGRIGRQRLRRQRQHLPPRQRARRQRGILYLPVDLFEIVRPRVQLEKAQQLALGLVELLPGGPALKLQPQPRRRRAQRVAVRQILLERDQPLLLEALQHLLGALELALQRRLGQAPRLEQPQQPRRVAVARLTDQQLPDHVAALVRQAPDPRPPDLARQRRHRPQHLAERRAVVFGHPAPQRQQLRLKHRLGVEQPQHVLHRHRRPLIVQPQHHPGQLPRPERRRHPAPRLNPVPQRLRHSIRERPVDRNRQAEVGVGEKCLHHG